MPTGGKDESRPMNDDELLERLRARRADPATRVDMHPIPVPRLYDCAHVETLHTEVSLGIELPPLLLRIYTEVGNGGFGPGSGMLGLKGGYADVDGRVLTERCQYLIAHGWPRRLLPLWDWGCAAWSCVDAASVGARIVTADEHGFTVTRFKLDDWLAEWCAGVELHGEIFEIEDASMMNPFTHEPMSIKCRGKAKGEPLGSPP